VAYNQAAADDCVARASTFTCPVVQAADYKTMTQQCYAAATGTTAIGATGCRASIECVPGSYCDLVDASAPEGGVATGVCRGLRAAGALCADQPRHEACSYRSSGSVCDSNNPDASARVCIPLKANGQACAYQNPECQSGLCDNIGNCGTSGTITQPYLCDPYKITDAGGGG
jgi:hypothetical protein